MKKTYVKFITRSWVKTVVTLILLSITAFLFIHNLSEYYTVRQKYIETKRTYEGILTVGTSEIEEIVDPRYSFFILTDETNPGRTFERFAYEEFHVESVSNEIIEELRNMKYVTRVDRRYMTSGISEKYFRMDNDQKYFNYGARCVLTGTVKDISPSEWAYENPSGKIHTGYEVVIDNVDMLAGDERWLEKRTEQTIQIRFLDESVRDKYAFYAEGNNSGRFAITSIDLNLFEDTVVSLEVGHKYTFVLRNEPKHGGWHSFYVGDDTRIGWWPYFYDITGLDSNWLDEETFEPLKELIQVTNDDLHTFDVVYTDDMQSISRVANGRIICRDGRWLSMDDIGKAVCVVSEAFLEQNGLNIGDKIGLKLGNYLCEQYAPLGAVANTRGRYASEFEEAEFEIIGSYEDLNDGAHLNRDLYWCYSDNTVFVPTSFLPETVDIELHEFKPAEISFVIENAEDIGAFIDECLPQIEQMGLVYNFYDGGWLEISNQLLQAQKLAFYKMVVYFCAVMFAVILVVWLFIGRRKKDYGILRALGMNKRNAAKCLFIPINILAVLSAVLGGIMTIIVKYTKADVQMLEVAKQTSDEVFGILLVGMVMFLIVVSIATFIGFLRLRRKSILQLLQEGNSK